MIMIKYDEIFLPLDKPFDMLKHGKQLETGKVNLLGFGFDGTACFRKGTVLGPEAIRNASSGLESYSPYLDADLEELSEYMQDLGDLRVSATGTTTENYLVATKNLSQYISTQNLKLTQTKFLLIGGEHSVSYGQIREYLHQYKDLAILHLDAHADLRDGYQGYYYSHASIMRRCLDHFEPTHQLMQYGIRSGTKSEYQWMQKHNTLITNRENLIEQLENISNTRPIYLSLDFDFFDPSFFPGTGTPEPGGEDFYFFIKIIKILKNKNFVGADAVELAPNIDKTGNSSVFAAKVVRELLIALSWSLN
jgi:agmatinase